MKLVHPDKPSATGREGGGRGGTGNTHGSTSASQSRGEPETFYTLGRRRHRRSVAKLKLNAELQTRSLGCGHKYRRGSSQTVPGLLDCHTKITARETLERETD